MFTEVVYTRVCGGGMCARSGYLFPLGSRVVERAGVERSYAKKGGM